jgi:hypothetical protein
VLVNVDATQITVIAFGGKFVHQLVISHAHASFNYNFPRKCPKSQNQTTHQRQKRHYLLYVATEMLAKFNIRSASLPLSI